MKKFEFLILYTYIKDNKWVIYYEENELDKYEYIDAIFCELGTEGWTLVSTSSNLVTDKGSGSLMDGYGDIEGSDTFTNQEVFYFQKEVTNISNYSKIFQDKIQHVRDIKNRKKVSYDIKKKTYDTLSDLIDKLLLEKGYEKKEGIFPEVKNSWYKDRVKEQINKKMFAENEVIKYKEYSRVDIYLEKKLVITLYTSNDAKTWNRKKQSNDAGYEFKEGNIDKIIKFIDENLD